MSSSARLAAIALVNELRDDRRISSVEAAVLRAAIEQGNISICVEEPQSFDPAWISCERTKRGISQAELAEAAGVSRQAVTQWESGRTQPSFKSLNSIRSLFALYPEKMFGSVEIIKQQIKLFGGQKSFALKIGMSQGNLSRVVTGKQPITAELAMTIERITDGKVNKSQLRPDLWPAA